jgi:hypothetical protein
VKSNSFTHLNAWTRRNSALAPALLLALLPKCPVCLAGVLVLVGLEAVVGTSGVLVLTLVAVLGFLAILGVGARRRGNKAPLWLGIAASILVLFGKVFFAADGVLYAGMCGLFVASIWNSWPARAGELTDACCANQHHTCRDELPAPVESRRPRENASR